MATITLVDLQAALVRCLNAHPTNTTDFTLDPDASRLIDLFGAMWFYKSECVAADTVKPKILEVFERWRITA